jgi:hypothetical protein
MLKLDPIGVDRFSVGSDLVPEAEHLVIEEY